MKSLPFILILSFISIASVCQIETPKEILMRSFETLNHKKSAEYTVVYKIKFFDNNDTTTFSSNVFLLRKKTDSILNGMVWFTFSDSEYKFYDTHRIFYVNKNKKKAIVYNPHRGETSVITGNSGSDVIWPFFLEPRKVQKLYDPVNSLKRGSDTIINGFSCYQIRVAFPDEDDFTERKQIVYVDKHSFIPILQIRSIKFQGNYQYNEFSIKNVSFDKVSLSRFSSKQIPKTYTVSNFSRLHTSKENACNTLKIGSSAPIIAGKNYKKQMESDSIDFRGKITFLDFWYMSCYPCMSAIPILEKLKAKYAGTNFNMVGINVKDNNEERLKKVPKFLEYNPIDYSMLFVDQKIVDSYHVEIWPTFFIIDTDGKVRYTQYGFSDSLFQQLDSAVGRLIK